MELILPCGHYYLSYLEAIEENKRNNVDSGNFIGVTRPNIIEHFENCRLGINLPEGYAPRTGLWLVDNGGFIGEIVIRHSLSGELMRIAGHIGYAVRYSKWNMGYGTEMLSMALEYTKENLNFDKVLILCDDDNYASARVIEKNGGKLWDKIIEDEAGDKETLLRRYRIEL